MKQLGLSCTRSGSLLQRVERRKALAVYRLLCLGVWSSAWFSSMAAGETCPENCQCAPQERKASCNVDQIPTGLPPGTIHLTLTSATTLGGLGVLTPGIFENLTSLFHLDLTRSNITDIHPGAFAGLRNLQTLILADNRLTVLVNGSLADLRLKRLDLKNNDRLEMIEAEALRNTAVERLDLSQCRLRALPVKLFYSARSTLSELTLVNNRVDITLPHGLFSQMEQNLTLYMTNDGLSNVEFLFNVSCTFLDLSFNPLGNGAWDVFKHIRSITDLYLQNVSLTQIRLTESKDLSGLDLSGNIIREINKDDFQSAPQLTSLILKGIGIAGLPEDFAQAFVNEMVLDLRDNNFKLLSPGPFVGAKFRLLDLRNNKLQTIAESMKGVFENCSELYLEDNPLHCTCEMRWFVEWAKAHRPQRLIVRADCRTPVVKPIITYHPEQLVCGSPVALLNKLGGVEPTILQPLSLVCKGKGDPAPALQLRGLNDTILEDVPAPLDKDVRVTTVSYSIQRFTCSMLGNYTCWATSPGGEDTGRLEINRVKGQAVGTCTEEKDVYFVVPLVVCIAILCLITVVIVVVLWVRRTQRKYNVAAKQKQHQESTAVAYINRGLEVNHNK